MNFFRNNKDFIEPNNGMKNIKDSYCTIPYNESNNLDEYIVEAGRFIIEKDKASIGMLQRMFKIGFSRAAKIMDQLYELGVVSEEEGTKPRRILMDQVTFSNLISAPPQPPVIANVISPLSLPDEDIIKSSLGIDTNFSNDGKMLSMLKNTLVDKCKNESQLDIINFIITYNSSKTLRFIIFDDNIEYFAYKTLPQLLTPIVSEKSKLVTVIHWLNSEKKDRLLKFANCNVKDINAYNSVNITETSYVKLPYIIFVISEFYPLRSDQQLNEDLMQLLMNSERTGIYCLLFSTLDAKRLSLGVKEDLLKIYDAEHFKNTLLMSIHPDPEILIHRNLSELDDMDGLSFENYCAKLLLKNGFYNIEVTQTSADHGIDILAEKDDISYAIQCKCYSSNIGNAAVQQAHTGKSIYHKDIAVVLTNQYFTEQAKEEASMLGVKLWDRNKLITLINSAK